MPFRDTGHLKRKDWTSFALIWDPLLPVAVVGGLTVGTMVFRPYEVLLWSGAALMSGYSLSGST